MGHFTITLPNNQRGDVRWGTIRKKALLMNLFRKNKLKDEERKGYIVRIFSPTGEQKEYRLLKTNDGQWVTENMPGFPSTNDDEMSPAIKRAIDEFENRP